MIHNGFKIDGRTLRSVRYNIVDEADRLKNLLINKNSKTEKLRENTPLELIAAWYYLSDAVRKIDSFLFHY